MMTVRPLYRDGSSLRRAGGHDREVPNIVPVDDPADPRLVEYTQLTDVELRRQFEDPAAGLGVFVAEGRIAVRRLLNSLYPTQSLLVTPARFDALAPDVEGRDVTVFVAAQPVMDATVGFHIHRGVLAVGRRLPLPDPEALLARATCVAVLEEVNDHENMGALFRNASAFGVDAVLLCPRCCDPLYRRSVRVSVGHALTVPFTRLAPWPDGLASVRRAGFTVAAMTPHADAEAIDALAARRPERVAVLLGAEGPGLTPAAMAAADLSVRIPMVEGGDSLNVATAAAIAFHRLTAAG
jgi:tRNA G18 (ribose-2'-O)-methylase SpoU